VEESPSKGREKKLKGVTSGRTITRGVEDHREGREWTNGGVVRKYAQRKGEASEKNPQFKKRGDRRTGKGKGPSMNY